jgi:ketosteroid isomerase-like protein
MYKIRIPLLVYACVLVGSNICAGADDEQAKSTAAAKETLTRLCDALRSGDIASVMKCYAESDDLVVIQSYGRIDKGADRVRKMYKDSFAEVRFERVELKDIVLKRVGDVAWASCRFVADTQRNVEKDKWRLEIQTSFVLERKEGTRRIVLEHSTPIEGIVRVRPRD